MPVTEDRTLGQAKSPLKCVFAGNTLTISSTSMTSKFNEQIFTEKVGEDLEISFQCRYLLEAMRACNGERVQLALNGPLMSMVVRPVEESEDGRFLFLVLPVKTKN